MLFGWIVIVCGRYGVLSTLRRRFFVRAVDSPFHGAGCARKNQIVYFCKDFQF